MPDLLTRDDLARWLRPGMRLYWPGCAGASPLFERWLREVPDVAAGLSFSGVWIPGVNRFDPTSLHPSTRAQTFFVPTDLHASMQRGAVDYLPWHYTEMARHFAQPGGFDVLMLHVSPPDAQGQCSYSVAADFSPLVAHAASASASTSASTVVLAHLNPRLPRTQGPTLPVRRITAWVHADEAPLIVADMPPDAAMAAVAARVAALVHDGDTLQFGLGKLQAAVMAALTSHRRLRIHSGMVSDGVLSLIEHQALDMSAAPMSVAPITTGVALGSERLYQTLANPALARFAPVSQTHALVTLAALPRFTAINSAMEIDLLGRANVRTLGGRVVSGVGGLVDFMHGARASLGGRAIIGMTACAGRAKLSRIVPLLDLGQVDISADDIDIVVTEHGVAALRHLRGDARAQALIALAAPEHRAALQDVWERMQHGMPAPAHIAASRIATPPRAP